MNKKIKKLFTLSSLLLLPFLLKKSQASESFSVTFTPNPLFSTEDGLWFPGRSLQKSFTVNNPFGENIYVSATNVPVESVTDFTLKLSNPLTTIFNSTLSDFLSHSPTLLTQATGSATYYVEISLPEEASNEMSGKNINFDLQVYTEAEELGAESDTRQSQSTPSASTDSGNNDSSNQQNGSSSGSDARVSENSVQLTNNKEEILPIVKSKVNLALESVSNVVNNEVAPSSETEPQVLGTAYERNKPTLLDVLLQNNPNALVLIIELLILLLLAYKLAKQSGYL